MSEHSSFSLLRTEPEYETELKMGDKILFEREHIEYVGRVIGFYTNSVLVEVDAEPIKFGESRRTVVNLAKLTLFKKVQTA